MAPPLHLFAPTKSRAPWRAVFSAAPSVCARTHAQLEPWTAGSHYVAGLAHESVGRYAPALDSFGAALALDPHHAPSLIKQGAARDVAPCTRGGAALPATLRLA